MNKSVKQFLKYDRTFLVLTVLWLIAIGAFLYYVSNSHQIGCDYYYRRTAEKLLPFAVGIPTLLAIYSFVKLTLRNTIKPTNTRLFGVILGAGALLACGFFAYVIVGFGAFFAAHC